MTNDDLPEIPSFAATRDDMPQGAATRFSDDSGAARQSPERSAKPGGAGIWARLFITVALVVAAVACAWAWQLQEELRQSQYQLEQWGKRVSDLEDRLSDTDEGMSQNATVQAAKIRELDTEVRKLWDNVWKKARERLGKLETSSASQGKKIAANESALSTARAGLKSATADIGKLNTLAGDLERLMKNANSSQVEIERLADGVNQYNLELAKLNKRVGENEEWVSSINAFRGQVNAALTRLQASITALQSGG